MATLLLSAAGAAIGSSIGGSVLGIGAAALGRAVGATVGRLVDDKILGAGSRRVETGRIDRFRLTGASEGLPVPSVHGRVRVSGQVIWASRFRETVTEEGGGGGKGTPSQPTVTSYSYSVSLAIALSEGVISRLGRIWADGIEISPADLSFRLYPGDDAQLPDPVIEAVEGVGEAPAYRGIAYVVIEDLPLQRFGNRIPQFTFEVMRTGAGDPASRVRAIGIGPGMGEYALATTPVHFEESLGRVRSANVNTASGVTDFEMSVRALEEELPGVSASALSVSWFAGDLRAGRASCQPKVEQGAMDGVGMGWAVDGVTRAGAAVLPEKEGRSVYGGTPADRAVIEAIGRLGQADHEVMLSPVLLMDQIAGNGLADPTGGVEQPETPWRGLLEPEPGQDVTAEVDAFFGSAVAGDFSVSGGTVSYIGGDGFTYRRFVLHYAHLAAVAGGVSAFLIGSELVGLTRARAGDGSFPAVGQLKALAAEVRAILGPGTKVGYGADWTEYHSVRPVDAPGDVLFPLDALWSDANIDFVGISNYMPVSDWRGGTEHADAGWGAIYDLGYLQANIAGGEGHDWEYRTEEARALQIRSPIEDAAFGEHWVYRWKDIASWWSEPHHERVSGARAGAPTGWVPGSKPVWFTELGCPAVDRGTNAPGRRVEAEARDSSGARDDLLQARYLDAVATYWDDPERNPVSSVYGGPMVATDRMFFWGWDARPYPQFPASLSVWSDGAGYGAGHILAGRMASRSLASVVEEVCTASGLTDVDVSGLYGLVRGVSLEGGRDARAALQPLLMAAGADAVERDGQLVFRSRGARLTEVLSQERLVWAQGTDVISHLREAQSGVAGRVQLDFLEADGDYEVRAAEARFPDADDSVIARSELPLVLTQGEGRALTERWLSEVRVARESVRFTLPPSSTLAAGDVVAFEEDTDGARYRIDRIEEGGERRVEAVRIDAGTFEVAADAETIVARPPVLAPLPVASKIMDLPLVVGEEAVAAPWVVAASDPWPGSVAVYMQRGSVWRFETELTQRALIGETLNGLGRASPHRFDRGPALKVRLVAGALSSIDEAALYSGGNAALIRSAAGGPWEVFQFRDAVLSEPDVWDLSMRLRGQQGTDGTMPESYPTGSRVVILDGALRQMSLRSNYLGQPQVYRVGPANKPVDHPSFTTIEATTFGLGFRPYAPAHVRARRDESGDVTVTWVRRTRIDGDRWEPLDVPLGEVAESYVVRVFVGSALRREVTVSTPSWTYGAAEAAADGVTGAYRVEVAQISDRFGPGLFGKVEIND
ncbi:host specificity protein [Alphaproteobacteria bacterium GH1-50]|uniref:Host specificity protein n=1 Tax=Kangsaoukella pontilimi TaxID=2691042 RepID=A0A7C9MD94_9RHOB|nr:glycoside hydrolase/phage tail family protein [Kangsaoukella pontilimi]MXQ07632.1 host specificity protein [Kangsaoukella pontilimi]